MHLSSMHLSSMHLSFLVPRLQPGNHRLEALPRARKRQVTGGRASRRAFPGRPWERENESKRQVTGGRASRRAFPGRPWEREKDAPLPTAGSPAPLLPRSSAPLLPCSPAPLRRSPVPCDTTQKASQ